MIAPHGGTLVEGYADAEQAQAIREEAESLLSVALNPRQLSDAHMIAQGAFSPLTGFMGHEDYTAVVKTMHLADGQPWSLPITLGVDSLRAADLREGKRVAMTSESGDLVGILTLEGKYRRDREEEAQEVFRTTEEQHPGVANMYQEGDVLLGGKITMLPGRPNLEEGVEPYYRTPAETREAIEGLGWNTVVGFQTRNPVHRAHEYIQKCAMEARDGLLLHPLVGETKGDDIPAPVRMRCYQALLENYYPSSRVLLTVLPAFMRYAGPREAIFHALVRKNYGCTHFIVGRDHAGVGNYYGPYDAQHIFREFSPDSLGIMPLFFENSFFCRRCQGMGTEKTCPHGADHRVSLSGTQVRAMLAQGEMPPEEFTRPEVARVLMESMAAARPG
ncbi:MAG: sulfate adenylyltransferase [Chloroflexota bacterium]|nr:sulfate adenylyltransferase [Chloroflexota bacterium]MDE2941839.1 sulfate adenylyltransferase [Chloroflexota bacterium]MDE3268311.1 sulfate adenylyltransferase [Chloroflexota bacterium]